MLADILGYPGNCSYIENYEESFFFLNFKDLKGDGYSVESKPKLRFIPQDFPVTFS